MSDETPASSSPGRNDPDSPDATSADDASRSESEPFTGEVDVPAAPRSANAHVNAAASDDTDAGAEDELAAAESAEPEPVAAEQPAVEPVAADEQPAAAEQPATAAEPQHPVTEVYDEPDTAATDVGWAPTPPAPDEPYQEPVQQEQRQGPVYITAPTPPKDKGNRSAGILISIVAAIAFAVITALVVFAIFAITRQQEAITDLWRYIATPAYWATAIIFALTMFLLTAIANRGGWWWYVLGGFLVGAVVYFAYIGATLLTNAWELAPSQVSGFVAQLWAHPLTFATAVVAREVSVWFGAWIAARGRTVTKRNLDARREYDRTMAENPPRYPTA